MEDVLLSRAVVAYIWGDRRESWPASRPDAVRREFPGRADELIARVEEIIRLTDQVRPVGDLAEVGDAAIATVRRAHPELTEAALLAIGNLFAYSWR